MMQSKVDRDDSALTGGLNPSGGVSRVARDLGRFHELLETAQVFRYLL
jgi:hypothetical protein